jgi:hypothetical protein
LEGAVVEGEDTVEEGIVDAGGGAGLVAEEGLGIGGGDVDFDYGSAEVCQEGGLDSDE